MNLTVAPLVTVDTTLEFIKKWDWVGTVWHIKNQCWCVAVGNENGEHLSVNTYRYRADALHNAKKLFDQCNARILFSLTVKKKLKVHQIRAQSLNKVLSDIENCIAQAMEPTFGQTIFDVIQGTEV